MICEKNLEFWFFQFNFDRHRCGEETTRTIALLKLFVLPYISEYKMCYCYDLSPRIGFGMLALLLVGSFGRTYGVIVLTILLILTTLFFIVKEAWHELFKLSGSYNNLRMLSRFWNITKVFWQMCKE